MLDINTDNDIQCFSNHVSCMLKDGCRITFWQSNWLANQSLNDSFPEIFCMAEDPFINVADAGTWEEGVWNWNFK